MTPSVSADAASIPERRRFPSPVMRAVGRSFLMVLRLVGLLLGLVTAIAVGIIPPWVLSSFKPDIPKEACIAFGASTILLVLKQLFETAPDAWAFVASGRTEALPRFASQVAIAALGFGTAAFFVKSSDEPPVAPKPLTINLPNMPLPPIIVDDRNLLIVPILFSEGKSELDQGDAQPVLIQHLTRTLAACIQQPNDVVRVDVRAFASTSGGDAKNKELSEGRAGLVVKTITDAIPTEVRPSFTVTSLPWPTVGAMKRRRRFIDTTEAGEYSKDAGMLNRRAEIWIQSAGSCFTE